MKKSFEFNGKELPYFDHPYNNTLGNERSIEVSIAKEFFRGDVLEIGRVLPHYGFDKHDVVDKFEEGGILADVLTWVPTKQYDTIISISTIEHVGEESGNKGQSGLDVIAWMRKYVKFAGTIFVTVPYGYNKDMDAAIEAEERLFKNEFYFFRDNEGDWHQTKELIKRPYTPGCAQSLYIGVE
jgi:hypothetical protein